MLHPVFETTFSTITTRLANNLQTNVVIRITDFCDTNDNEYVSVDLLLNRGGMALSLIYIDNDSTDNTDGYWMFLNNWILRPKISSIEMDFFCLNFII